MMDGWRDRTGPLASLSVRRFYTRRLASRRPPGGLRLGVSTLPSRSAFVDLTCPLPLGGYHPPSLLSFYQKVSFISIKRK